MYCDTSPPAGLFSQKKHFRVTKYPRRPPVSQPFCRESCWRVKMTLCLILNKKMDAEQKSQVLK